MSKPYLERKYVELHEETEDGYSLENDRLELIRTWYARADGPLSTGEQIQVVRSSQSLGEALLLLTEALEEQGWRLR